MNRISELKFKVYHSMPVGGKHRTTERDMTLSKIRESIRLILKTYNMNGYSPITVGVGGGSSSGDYIRIDIEGYVFGFGRVDHHVLSIERPSNLPEEMFFNIEDSLDKEFGSMVKKAEMKFLVKVVKWDANNNKLLSRGSMSVGEIKNTMRKFFDFDDLIEVENPKKSFKTRGLDFITIHNENVFVEEGHSIIIDRPEDMDEELFQKILKGAGLLEEHEIKALGRSLSKRAEMKFNVLVGEWFNDGTGSPLKRNKMSIGGVKDQIRNTFDFDEPIVLEKKSDAIWIENEHRDGNGHTIIIKCPEDMDEKLFQKILKGAGLWEERDIKALGRSLSKRAERKFNVSVVGWDANNSRVLKRGKMTIGEIKDQIRNTFDFEEQVSAETVREMYSLSSLKIDEVQITNEHREADAGHSVIIYRPEDMDQDLFMRIIKRARLWKEHDIRSLGRSISKRAEMRFDISVYDWTKPYQATTKYKWSLKEIVSYVREEFLSDKGGVSISLDPDKRMVTVAYTRYGKVDDGLTLRIHRPSTMDWEVFYKILRRVDLTDSFMQYESKLYKRAEMRFELLVVRSRSGSRRNEMATRKEIENYVRDFNDVKTWSMEGSEWISVEGRNKEDNDLWVLHIKKPDNMEWRTFLMVLGGTGLEVDQFKNRKAEMKFDLTFIYDDGSGAGDMVDVVKGTLKDAKNYIRNNFKRGKKIHIEVEYSSDNVFYSQPDIEEGESSYEMYIGCPEGMKWELFLKILEGAGLLNTPKVNSLVKMKRKAELIFRVNYKSLHKHEKGFFAPSMDFLPMKQIIERMRIFYTGLRSLKDGVVDIHVKLRPSKYTLPSDVTYTFSTDSYRATLAIISPDTISPQVFLNILKGAGIYADNNEYDEKRIVRKRILKKSSIQKSAELKFDARRETWEVRGGKKHMDTEDKDMTLTEIKDKIREYFKHSYDGTASELEIDSYKRYQLVELYNQKHDECRTKGTVIMIACPDDMEWETFLKIIRLSGLLDENKVKRMY